MVAADDGMSLTAYDTWPPGLGNPSNLNFATCVSGVLFPPAFLQLMRDVGQGFRETCPRNDDLWLTYLAIEHRIPISQVAQESLHFDVIPGTQVTSLNASNVFEGQNDKQINQHSNHRHWNELSNWNDSKGIENDACFKYEHTRNGHKLHIWVIEYYNML